MNVARMRMWRFFAIVALWGLLGLGWTDIQAHGNPDFDDNGKVYMIGGQTLAGGSGPFLDAVYEYDPATAQ